MIFNVLLFKNANYQQIIWKEHYFITYMNILFISVRQRKALERQYVW